MGIDEGGKEKEKKGEKAGKGGKQRTREDRSLKIKSDWSSLPKATFSSSVQRKPRTIWSLGS